MKKLILIWIFVIFSSVVVGLTVNDVGISGLNYVINSTGIFAGSSSVQPNGYVTVCLDANECDYPCTDGDCETEIESAINSSNPSTVWFAPGQYDVEGAEIDIDDNMNVTLYGYDATLRKTVVNTGGKFINVGNRSSIAIYGLTIDINKSSGVGVGVDLGCYNTEIILRDCKFYNIYSFGVVSGAAYEGEFPTNDTLYVDNCEFYAGNSNSLNEPILTRSSKDVVIKNSYFLGNKHLYVVGESLRMDNLDFDTTGYSNIQNTLFHGRHIYTTNIRAKNLTLNYRPFGNVHLLDLYSDTNYIGIKGVSINGPDSHRIQIEPYNDTFGIGNVDIDGVYIETGEIRVKPYSIQNGSYIDKLSINDVQIDTFTASYNLLEIESVDIGQLTIRDSYTPGYGSGGAYFRVTTDTQNVTIDSASVLNVYPDANYLFIADASSGADDWANITIEYPYEPFNIAINRSLNSIDTVYKVLNTTMVGPDGATVYNCGVNSTGGFECN